MMQWLRLSLQPKLNWQALELPQLSLSLLPLLQLSLPLPLRLRLPLLLPQPQPRVRPATPVLQQQSQTRPGVLQQVPPVLPQPQQVQVGRQSQQLELRRRRSQLHLQVGFSQHSDGRGKGLKARGFPQAGLCDDQAPKTPPTQSPHTQCWSKVCVAHWVCDMLPCITRRSSDHEARCVCHC